MNATVSEQKSEAASETKDLLREQVSTESQPKTSTKVEPEPRTESEPSIMGEETSGLKPGLLVKVMNEKDLVREIQESCGLQWNTEISEVSNLNVHVKQFFPPHMTVCGIYLYLNI